MEGSRSGDALRPMETTQARAHRRSRSRVVSTEQSIDYDTIIIYHGQCPDGVTSAWIAARSPTLGRVCCHPASERDFYKDEKMPSLFGKRVVIVDYSYPREILDHLKSITSGLLVLDHHKTAQQDLQDYPGAIFDLSKCAAEITWDYYFSDHVRPWFLQHIRDRDLWLWEHPDSKAFASVFFNDGLTFETLDHYSTMSPEEITDLYARGRMLLKAEQQLVTLICRNARPVTLDGNSALFVNTNVHTSECGNALIESRGAQLAILGSYTPFGGPHKQSMWNISLRGSKGSDWSGIAKKYGGGGHPQACGFVWNGPIEDLLSMSE